MGCRDQRLIEPLAGDVQQTRGANGSLVQEECLDLLTQLSQGVHCRIYIDAIDECTDPDTVLATLKYMHQAASKVSNTQLQFLISGRPYNQLEKQFKYIQGYDRVVARLRISEHDPGLEMETFLLTELDTKRESSDHVLFKSPALVDRVVRVLLERAGSMFRWTELQIELFTHKKVKPAEHIRRRLNSLEAKDTNAGLSDLEKLTETYQEVYDLEKDDTTQLRAILVYNLLLCAFAELSINDLVEALRNIAKPEDAKEIDADYINDICTCFITVSYRIGIATMPLDLIFRRGRLLTRLNRVAIM